MKRLLSILLVFILLTGCSTSNEIQENLFEEVSNTFVYTFEIEKERINKVDENIINFWKENSEII